MTIETLASLLCRTYDALPRNGKPQNANEFTVLAGIAVTSPACDPFIASLATGTRSAGGLDSEERGLALRDSHAEVLARRAFLRFVMSNLLTLQNQPSWESNPQSILTHTHLPPPSTPITLKPGYEFHLIISDSPCGDACIYTQQNGKAAFTGAKLVMGEATLQKLQEMAGNSSFETLNSCDASHVTLVREREEQLVGCIRTKPGRSDIAIRSLSMSCSDKIARWVALGLQGKMLSRWVGRIPLASITVGRDPTAMNEGVQLKALQRAILERLSPFLGEHRLPAPSIHVVDLQSRFPSSKACVQSLSQASASLQEAEKAHPVAKETNNVPPKTEKGCPVHTATAEACNELSTTSQSTKRKKALVACSTSINWFLDASCLADTNHESKPNTAHHVDGKEWIGCGQIEVTTGNDGMIQGCTKKRKWSGEQTPCRPSPHTLHTNNARGVSRLSSASFGLAWTEIAQGELPMESRTLDCAQWKEILLTLRTNESYDQLESSFFDQTEFQDWVRTSRLTETQDESRCTLHTQSQSNNYPHQA